MNWAYIGGGSWELQGGLFLGCVYGSKFDDGCRMTVEKVVHTVSPNAIEVLWTSESGPVPLEEAKMLVEAHMEDLYRVALRSLRGVYRW